MRYFLKWTINRRSRYRHGSKKPPSGGFFYVKIPINVPSLNWRR